MFLELSELKSRHGFYHSLINRDLFIISCHYRLFVVGKNVLTWKRNEIQFFLLGNGQRIASRRVKYYEWWASVVAVICKDLDFVCIEFQMHQISRK